MKISFYKRALTFLFLSVWLCSVQLSAQATDTSDHPLLTKLPGFEVSEKEVKNSEAIELKDFEIKGTPPKGQIFPWVLEGKITTIKYLDEKEARSNIEIFNNYDTALKKLGATQLNTDFSRTSDEVRLGNHIYRLPAKSGAAPIYVVLYINSPQWYSLTYIEPTTAKQEVTTGSIEKEIESKGFATIHINFDTNKSTLKQDGQTAVQEIAELLKKNSSLNLSVDGHTDNVGSPAANKKLSLDRAQSVVTAVVAQGIDAKRLKAQGFGAEKSVADNKTEAGRTQNRRVELVKQ
jgi:OmpA-OmpF porin, OOP family